MLMKHVKIIFAVIGLCAIMPAFGASLLKATQFPKTFDDLPFADKWKILAQEYDLYDTIYDAKTGKCLWGCPYVGITLDDAVEMAEIADANDAQDLLENHDWVMDADTGNLHPSDIDVSDISSGGDAYYSVQNTDNKSCLHNRYIRNDRDIPYGNPLGYNAKITSGYGKRLHPTRKVYHFHNGVDFAAKTNSNVYATANGRVVDVGQDKWNGKYIKIEHPSGYKTIYLHLNSQSVKIGDTVHSGCLIGKSGNTGTSTGPHLHYSIKKGNNYLNPQRFLSV